MSEEKTLSETVAEKLDSIAQNNAQIMALVKKDQEFDITISHNGYFEIIPDEGFTLSKVKLTINV